MARRSVLDAYFERMGVSTPGSTSAWGGSLSQRENQLEKQFQATRKQERKQKELEKENRSRRLNYAISGDPDKNYVEAVEENAARREKIKRVGTTEYKDPLNPADAWRMTRDSVESAISNPAAVADKAKNVGRGFAGGAYNMATVGVGKTTQYLGGRVKSMQDDFSGYRKAAGQGDPIIKGEDIERAGKVSTDYWEQKISESRFDPEAPENQAFSTKLGYGASTLVGAIGLSVATKSPTAASAAFASLEAGDFYTAAKDAGMDTDTAGDYATASGVSVGVLEKFGLDKFFKAGSGKIVSRFIGGTTVESVQEASQTASTNFWAKMSYDEKRSLMEGVTEAAILGGIVGGFGRAAIPGSATNTLIKPLKDKGLSDEEANAVAEKMVADVSAPVRAGIEQSEVAEQLADTPFTRFISEEDLQVMEETGELPIGSDGLINPGRTATDVDLKKNAYQVQFTPEIVSLLEDIGDQRSKLSEKSVPSVLVKEVVPATMVAPEQTTEAEGGSDIQARMADLQQRIETATEAERPQLLKEVEAIEQEIAASSEEAGTKKPSTRSDSQKTISKELEPLAEEARKYKSADEFVKKTLDAKQGNNLDSLRSIGTTVPIAEFGEKGKIALAETKVDDEGVKRWETRIKAGERPVIEIGSDVTGVKVKDGSHRLQAYKNLGIEQVPIVNEIAVRDFYDQATQKPASKPAETKPDSARTTSREGRKVGKKYDKKIMAAVDKMITNQIDGKGFASTVNKLSPAEAEEALGHLADTVAAEMRTRDQELGGVEKLPSQSQVGSDSLGFIRGSTNSQFYRQFYKIHKKKPTKGDYIDEAHRVLRANKDPRSDIYLQLREKVADDSLSDEAFQAELDAIKFQREATSNSLLDEARKFDTVEDFINSRPLVYHGSPNIFETFDLSNLGAQGFTEGKGFYFTDDKDIAQGYAKGETAKLYEVELSIKKPMTLEQRKITDKQLREVAEKILERDPDGMANYGGDIDFEGKASAIQKFIDAEGGDMNETDVDLIASISNGGVLDSQEINRIFVEVTGYDGVITKWPDGQNIYVAFTPEQITTREQLEALYAEAKDGVKFQKAQGTDATAAQEALDSLRPEVKNAEWKYGYHYMKSDLRKANIPRAATGFSDSASVVMQDGKPVIAYNWFEDGIDGFAVREDLQGKGYATRFLAETLIEEEGELKVIDANDDMLRILRRIGNVSKPAGDSSVIVTHKNTPKFQKSTTPKEIHWEDQLAMVEFIDAVRLNKPTPAQELAATRIAEHYNLPTPKTRAAFANALDKALQLQRKKTWKNPKYRPPKRSQSFQRQETGTTKKLEPKQARALANRILGNDIPMRFVESISTPDGANAYGQYHKGVLTFAAKVKDTTYGHEIAHYLVDHVMSQQQWNGFKQELDIADNNTAEEVFAERMGEYVNNRTGNWSTRLKQMFDDFWNTVKRIVRRHSDIQAFFKQAYEGQFAGEITVPTGVVARFQEQSLQQRLAKAQEKYSSSKAIDQSVAKTPEELELILAQLKKVLKTQSVPVKSAPENIGAYARELAQSIDKEVNGSTGKNTLKVLGGLSKSSLTTVRKELMEITNGILGTDIAESNPAYFYSDTEMFTRFLESYIRDPAGITKKAPVTTAKFEAVAEQNEAIDEFIKSADRSLDAGIQKQRQQRPVETSIPGTPEGTTKTSRLAERVEQKAIANKLTEEFGNKVEYNSYNMEAQAQKAAKLISENPELAKDIAMGRKQPPEGLLPESVFVAVVNQAVANGDYQTTLELGSISAIPQTASIMGARIRTLAEMTTDSPVDAIRTIQDSRQERSRKGKRGKTRKKAEKKEKARAKETMDNTKISMSKLDAFIKEVAC